MKPTQSHWRRRQTHAGADSAAADADVVDQVALGQKPCRLRRQLYSITGFLLLLLVNTSEYVILFKIKNKCAQYVHYKH